MMKRKCSKCGISKDENESNFNRRGYPRVGFRSECKECSAKLKKMYRANPFVKKREATYEHQYRKTVMGKLKKSRLESRRKKNMKIKNRRLIQSLKSNSCTDCHIVYPYYCMDFDHLDPNIKKWNINSIMNKGTNTILSEIQKCELVCANCHRLREFHSNIKFYESSRYKSVWDRILKIIKIKSKPCMDCGGQFHYSQMDFDHKNGKILEVARMRYSPSVFDEIKKCELVCANCHRIRTYQRAVG